nr:hypothetical protein CFP56_68949 [Quercus suber]
MRIKQKDFAEHVKLFGVVGHVVKKLFLFGLAGVTEGVRIGTLPLFIRTMTMEKNTHNILHTDRTLFMSIILILCEGTGLQSTDSHE